MALSLAIKIQTDRKRDRQTDGQIDRQLNIEIDEKNIGVEIQ